MSDEASGLFVAEDQVTRCWWCAATPAYRAYHDEEWGFPVVDDHRLFEKLVLEGFQSGLSWLTILRKRDAFRQAFAGFDPLVVAGFGEADVARLLGDAAIVRHRGKIEAAIRNARGACALIEECGSLAAYLWAFAPQAEPPARSKAQSLARSTAPGATALAKDLKRRGWAFVGPTTVYAFMQAMGMVNDHLEGCAVREPADRARAALPRSFAQCRPGWRDDQ